MRIIETPLYTWQVSSLANLKWFKMSGLTFRTDQGIAKPSLNRNDIGSCSAHLFVVLRTSYSQPVVLFPLILANSPAKVE